MTWFKRMANLSNDPKINQGSDGSATYINNKKCEFVICKSENNSVVSFKPFIEKLSYNVETKHSDISEELLGVSEKVVLETDSLYFSIDLGLSVVSHSINEAKQNVKRINEVNFMFTSIEQNSIYQSNNHLKDRTRWERNLFIVYLNSLIGRNLTKGVKIQKKTDLLDFGVPVFLEKFDYSIDKSFGYFEYNGSLIPKKYTINFTFKVSNKAARTLTNLTDHKTAIGNWLWLPFRTPTKLFDNDCQSFPLGIGNISHGSVGSDGSAEYLSNKNAHVWFGTGINHYSRIAGEYKKGVFFSFKPFDLDINKSISSKNFNLKAIQKVGGTYTMLPSMQPIYDRDIKISFSIINHSINEAIQNTKKLQLLVRLLDSFTPKIFLGRNKAQGWNYTEKQEKGYFRILHNDLISKNFTKTPDNFESFANQAQLCFLKGFSFEVDKEMGFFEYNGLLLCKKINISLDIQEKEKNERSLVIYAKADYRDSEKARKLKRNKTSNQALFKNKKSFFEDK